MLYLSFSLGGFGRLHLSVSSSSPALALASRGQSCPQHGFLGCHDHPCLLHMRLWDLAWASGPVQEVDADHWALRPHNKSNLINIINFSHKNVFKNLRWLSTPKDPRWLQRKSNLGLKSLITDALDLSAFPHWQSMLATYIR